MRQKSALRSPARDGLADVKRRGHAAYEAARGCGGITALSADRYWSDTLAMMREQNPATQYAMLGQTRVLLDLLRDRASWPGR